MYGYMEFIKPLYYIEFKLHELKHILYSTFPRHYFINFYEIIFR